MTPSRADLCMYLDTERMNTCVPTNPEHWTSRSFCNHSDDPNSCPVYRRLQQNGDPAKEIAPEPYEACRTKVRILT